VKGLRTAGGEFPRDDLDGIAGLPDGELLVASHDGTIFCGAPRPREHGALDVTWTERFTDLEAPGDIGYDAKRNRVLIPLVLANSKRDRDPRAAAAAITCRIFKPAAEQILQQTFASFMIAFARRVSVTDDLLDELDGDEVLADAVADSKRVWGLVAGPLRARILPLECDLTAPRSSGS